MKAEVFYTGGGIWLAEMDLQNGTYAVVDSDYPECLSIYNYTDDEPYLPEDMIFSKGVYQLDSEEKKIYNQLLAALKEKTTL